ncbi:hypothetical protein BB560_000702 [Smittium megazygosporum]|uniref:Cleavage/polyadenylation specificity factor A subunit C-terminal domain-containing protein n=1 Tax=Smittium megazygosporum TaxID=133381 RepID=A0A2T9ZJQ4_9FUNG|nr:hypothetical protein BB560_000702 [Smittium megazygosporum]
MNPSSKIPTNNDYTFDDSGPEISFEEWSSPRNSRHFQKTLEDLKKSADGNSFTPEINFSTFKDIPYLNKQQRTPYIAKPHDNDSSIPKLFNSSTSASNFIPLAKKQFGCGHIINSFVSYFCSTNEKHSVLVKENSIELFEISKSGSLISLASLFSESPLKQATILSAAHKRVSLKTESPDYLKFSASYLPEYLDSLICLDASGQLSLVYFVRVIKYIDSNRETTWKILKSISFPPPPISNSSNNTRIKISSHKYYPAFTAFTTGQYLEFFSFDENWKTLLFDNEKSLSSYYHTYIDGYISDMAFLNNADPFNKYYCPPITIAAAIIENKKQGSNYNIPVVRIFDRINTFEGQTQKPDLYSNFSDTKNSNYFESESDQFNSSQNFLKNVYSSSNRFPLTYSEYPVKIVPLQYIKKSFILFTFCNAYFLTPDRMCNNYTNTFKVPLSGLLYSNDYTFHNNTPSPTCNKLNSLSPNPNPNPASSPSSANQASNAATDQKKHPLSSEIPLGQGSNTQSNITDKSKSRKKVQPIKLRSNLRFSKGSPKQSTNPKKRWWATAISETQAAPPDPDTPTTPVVPKNPIKKHHSTNFNNFSIVSIGFPTAYTHSTILSGVPVIQSHDIISKYERFYIVTNVGFVVLAEVSSSPNINFTIVKTNINPDLYHHSSDHFKGYSKGSPPGSNQLYSRYNSMFNFKVQLPEIEPYYTNFVSVLDSHLFNISKSSDTEAGQENSDLFISPQVQNNSTPKVFSELLLVGGYLCKNTLITVYTDPTLMKTLSPKKKIPSCLKIRYSISTLNTKESFASRDRTLLNFFRSVLSSGCFNPLDQFFHPKKSTHLSLKQHHHSHDNHLFLKNNTVHTVLIDESFETMPFLATATIAAATPTTHRFHKLHGPIQSYTLRDDISPFIKSTSYTSNDACFFGILDYSYFPPYSYYNNYSQFFNLDQFTDSKNTRYDCDFNCLSDNQTLQIPRNLVKCVYGYPIKFQKNIVPKSLRFPGFPEHYSHSTHRPNSIAVQNATRLFSLYIPLRFGRHSLLCSCLLSSFHNSTYLSLFDLPPSLEEFYINDTYSLNQYQYQKDPPENSLEVLLFNNETIYAYQVPIPSNRFLENGLPLEDHSLVNNSVFWLLVQPKKHLLVLIYSDFDMCTNKYYIAYKTLFSWDLESYFLEYLPPRPGNPVNLNELSKSISSIKITHTSAIYVDSANKTCYSESQQSFDHESINFEKSGLLIAFSISGSSKNLSSLKSPIFTELQSEYLKRSLVLFVPFDGLFQLFQGYNPIRYLDSLQPCISNFLKSKVVYDQPNNMPVSVLEISFLSFEDLKFKFILLVGYTRCMFSFMNFELVDSIVQLSDSGDSSASIFNATSSGSPKGTNQGTNKFKIHTVISNQFRFNFYEPSFISIESEDSAFSDCLAHNNKLAQPTHRLEQGFSSSSEHSDTNIPASFLVICFESYIILLLGLKNGKIAVLNLYPSSKSGFYNDSLLDHFYIWPSDPLFIQVGRSPIEFHISFDKKRFSENIKSFYVICDTSSKVQINASGAIQLYKLLYPENKSGSLSSDARAHPDNRSIFHHGLNKEHLPHQSSKNISFEHENRILFLNKSLLNNGSSDQEIFNAVFLNGQISKFCVHSKPLIAASFVGLFCSDPEFLIYDSESGYLVVIASESTTSTSKLLLYLLDPLTCKIVFRFDLPSSLTVASVVFYDTTKKSAYDSYIQGNSKSSTDFDGERYLVISYRTIGLSIHSKGRLGFYRICKDQKTKNPHHTNTSNKNNALLPTVEAVWEVSTSKPISTFCPLNHSKFVVLVYKTSLTIFKFDILAKKIRQCASTRFNWPILGVTAFNFTEHLYSRLHYPGFNHSLELKIHPLPRCWLLSLSFHKDSLKLVAFYPPMFKLVNNLDNIYRLLSDKRLEKNKGQSNNLDKTSKKSNNSSETDTSGKIESLDSDLSLYSSSLPTGETDEFDLLIEDIFDDGLFKIDSTNIDDDNDEENQTENIINSDHDNERGEKVGESCDNVLSEKRYILTKPVDGKNLITSHELETLFTSKVAYPLYNSEFMSEQLIAGFDKGNFVHLLLIPTLPDSLISKFANSLALFGDHHWNFKDSFPVYGDSIPHVCSCLGMNNFSGCWNEKCSLAKQLSFSQDSLGNLGLGCFANASSKLIEYLKPVYGSNTPATPDSSEISFNESQPFDYYMFGLDSISKFKIDGIALSLSDCFSLGYSIPSLPTHSNTNINTTATSENLIPALDFSNNVQKPDNSFTVFTSSGTFWNLSFPPSYFLALFSVLQFFIHRASLSTSYFGSKGRYCRVDANLHLACDDCHFEANEFISVLSNLIPTNTSLDAKTLSQFLDDSHFESLFPSIGDPRKCFCTFSCSSINSFSCVHKMHPRRAWVCQHYGVLKLVVATCLEAMRMSANTCYNLPHINFLLKVFAGLDKCNLQLSQNRNDEILASDNIKSSSSAILILEKFITLALQSIL